MNKDMFLEYLDGLRKYSYNELLKKDIESSYLFGLFNGIYCTVDTLISRIKNGDFDYE